MLAKPSITEILSYTEQIGAAALLAFAGGAIPVVPSPGDGKIILPLLNVVTYNFGTVDFSNNAALDIRYHGTSSSLLVAPIGTITGQGASLITQTSTAIGGGGDPNPIPLLNLGADLVLTAGAFALGGIGSASKTAAGTGYAVGDTGTVTTGNGDATYRILTIGAAGAVGTFAITFPGSGYATGAGQATATGGAQPGVGINFTVDVLTLVNGDGSLKVTTLYQVIDVP